MNDWTAAEILIVREKRAANWSHAQIASALTNRSKGSVAGIVHRLKLETKPRGTPAPVTPRRPRPPPKPVKEPSKKETPPMPIPVFDTVITAPVPMMQLQQHHCRAPLDQRGEDGFIFFCGAKKKEGSSYCPTHHQLFTALPREHQKGLLHG